MITSNFKRKIPESKLALNFEVFLTCFQIALLKLVEICSHSQSVCGDTVSTLSALCFIVLSYLCPFENQKVLLCIYLYFFGN